MIKIILFALYFLSMILSITNFLLASESNSYNQMFTWGFIAITLTLFHFL